MCANDLLEEARRAARNAYCPYSRFPVGAAVETERGVFTGCNVENASYGLAICAERVALFSAVAAGARAFRRLAVTCLRVAPDASVSERMPCGACRQVMAEFLPPEAEVIVDGAGIWKVCELLPEGFRMKGQSMPEDGSGSENG
ncbi:MAG: cytidine deaminase [Chloroherpetonaceae bacterium]|nr:cytidine deaminase [Chthonomonadaceae bacterium]MDW8207146.1 cytidine deaminase [Chloroherpetonaceae bacterium]